MAKARTLKVPLDFPTKGHRYEARIHAGGPGAGWRTAPERIAIGRQIAIAADAIDLALALAVSGRSGSGRSTDGRRGHGRNRR